MLHPFSWYLRPFYGAFVPQDVFFLLCSSCHYHFLALLQRLLNSCLPELTLHDKPPVLFNLFQRTENAFCLWLAFSLVFPISAPRCYPWEARTELVLRQCQTLSFKELNIKLLFGPCSTPFPPTLSLRDEMEMEKGWRNIPLMLSTRLLLGALGEPCCWRN